MECTNSWFSDSGASTRRCWSWSWDRYGLYDYPRSGRTRTRSLLHSNISHLQCRSYYFCHLNILVSPTLALRPRQRKQCRVDRLLTNNMHARTYEVTTNTDEPLTTIRSSSSHFVSRAPQTVPGFFVQDALATSADIGPVSISGNSLCRLLTPFV